MGGRWGSRSSLNTGEGVYKGDTGGTENTSKCQTEGCVGEDVGKPWEGLPSGERQKIKIKRLTGTRLPKDLWVK